MARHVRSVRVASVVAGILFLAGGALARASTVPTPPPIPVPLEPPMARMRDMIRNATTKFRSGVVGLGGAPTRPALQCCSMNVEAIHESSRVLDTKLEEMSACYATQSDSQMRANVEFAHADVAGVRRSLSNFAQAEDRKLTDLALGGLSKSYLLLLESVAKLSPCPAEPAPGATKASGKKKGKDKTPKAD